MVSFAGQVVQYINLGDFVGRNVPSLKLLEREYLNETAMGALSLLRTAMQLLQRCVHALYDSNRNGFCYILSRVKLR